MGRIEEGEKERRRDGESVTGSRPTLDWWLAVHVAHRGESESAAFAPDATAFMKLLRASSGRGRRDMKKIIVRVR